MNPDVWKSVVGMLKAQTEVRCPVCGGKCEPFELRIFGMCDACFSAPPAEFAEFADYDKDDVCPYCNDERYIEVGQMEDGRDWHMIPCPCCNAEDMDWRYDEGRRHLGI